METREIQIPRGALVGPEKRPLYGYATVKAKCLDGLAVHKALGKARWKWMVTHEASGMCIERLGAMTQRDALDRMRRALALDFDWARPAADVLAEMRERRDVVDAVNEIAASY